MQTRRSAGIAPRETRARSRPRPRERRECDRSNPCWSCSYAQHSSNRSGETAERFAPARKLLLEAQARVSGARRGQYPPLHRGPLRLETRQHLTREESCGRVAVEADQAQLPMVLEERVEIVDDDARAHDRRIE